MIEVRSLRKTYPGGVDAVRGIDFDVARGEVFGLLGPNGAGKSTTIGVLTTTIKPTAGSATVDGFDVSRDPLAARRASSVVFQEAVVDRGLTGRRHLELHAQLWRVEQRAAGRRIEEVVSTFGLAPLIDRTVRSYSGGERRRLELARALVSRPRVLFLDEPTVGLDPLIRHELLDLVAGLKSREELTILVTTHYLDEAERLCDRLAIMHAGRIVALGTPTELKQQLGRELLELRIDGEAPAALTLLRARGIASEDAFVVGSTVTVPLNGHTSSEAIAAIDELRLASSVISRPPTLDDVYLRLTGGGLAYAA